MASKQVLIVGASGVVGYAAIKHFRAQPDCEVVALSRRAPLDTADVRFIACDLTDRAQCADTIGRLRGVTHVVYAALYEEPNLVAGWRDDNQIRINQMMLENVLEPLTAAARGLRHVSLLQGTKVYGAHVRRIPVPAREGRDELRSQPNFYWQQEDLVRHKQHGRDWLFTIFRPVLIVGESVGSAMNLIPAIGVYAAMQQERGRPAAFPGGPARIAQAVDADLLARAIAWGGEAPQARNETFNVTNGDVFTWPAVWPAIAAALGSAAAEPAPLSLVEDIAPRGAEWDRIRHKHGLVAPDLAGFVGLSFQYADYQMGYGRTAAGPPSLVSTIKIQQAGFHEVMDTEAMFAKWFRLFQEKRLLPTA
jgi:nucleoside-diphosphate-sugar epimerase